MELPEFLPELAEPSKPRCFNLLVEHTKQLTSLDEAKMAERMTTAEMMREHNRMRLELVIDPGGVHSNASTGFRLWPPGLVDGCREKRVHVALFDCIDTTPIQ